VSGPFGESNVVPLPKWIYPQQISGSNYYLDFKESGGGAELSAVIDAGWYLPEDLATAVQAALNAAAVVGTYTVTFDRATEKYTIATDQAYLDLLWSSGTHAASGCHTALGFASGADDTGATSYVGDNILPNRFISSQPIRSQKPDFGWVRKSKVSDGGAQTTNFRRQERALGFKMMQIEEQNLKDDWLPMLVNSGAARGHPVDYYPNSLAADYVRAYLDMKGFGPNEMIPALPRFYEFKLSLREKIPQGGTVSFDELFTRTAP